MTSGGTCRPKGHYQTNIALHLRPYTAHAPKEKAAGSRMPSGGGLKSVLRGLEREPQADLHHAWRSLNLREVRPVRRRLQAIQGGIRIDRKIAVIGVRPGKMLRIGDVEHFPPECQLLFLAPGHRDDLAEPHVESHIAWRAQYIALPSLSRIRGAVALIRSDHIAPKKLRRCSRVAARRTSLHWYHLRHVALNFPVCGPLPGIIGLAIR